MYRTDDRFKDAPWYEQCKNEKILIVGLGGIGSNAIYYLTKTIPATYYLLDMDTVEEYNVGCQFFNMGDVGKQKVHALYDTISKYFNRMENIRFITNKYTSEYFPIMISALDNMQTRKQMFDVWKIKEDREIFIDGRLRANMYEVYIVTKGKEEEYEKTLFEDKDVDDGPCTFKQTSYFAGLVGARITHALVNYLTNKYNGDICTIPFKIQEVGEPFYIQIT